MVKAGCGETYGDKTATGLYDAKAMVAFCTSTYGEKTGRGWETYRELQYVHQHPEVHLIPVRLHPTYPPRPPDKDGRALCDVAFHGSLIPINGLRRGDCEFRPAKEVAEEIIASLKRLGIREDVRLNLPSR